MALVQVSAAQKLNRKDKAGDERQSGRASEGVEREQKGEKRDRK